MVFISFYEISKYYKCIQNLANLNGKSYFFNFKKNFIFIVPFDLRLKIDECICIILYLLYWCDHSKKYNYFIKYGIPNKPSINKYLKLIIIYIFFNQVNWAPTKLPSPGGSTICVCACTLQPETVIVSEMGDRSLLNFRLCKPKLELRRHLTASRAALQSHKYFSSKRISSFAS